MESLSVTNRRQFTILLWLLVFIGLQVFYSNHGENWNTKSRIALVFSLAEHELNIDRYLEYTKDWSQPPDGRYFSNKPPGPSLLAFPFYWPLDLWITRGARTREQRERIRIRHINSTQFRLSLLLQALPFTVVFLLAMWRIERLGISQRALNVSCLCTLVGNTAIIYMNTYFGHSFTAWVLIALFLSVESRSYAWTGFFFGLAVLSDYTMVILAPACAWAMCDDLKDNPVKVIGKVILGGLAPLAVFSAYHAACFGHPLTTADRYVNRIYVNVNSSGNYIGLFYPYPRIKVIGKLLFGSFEGILWTQPWVFVAGFAGWRLARRISFGRTLPKLALGGLSLVILLISAFGGWSGGNTAGPRYLSALFPLFGLMMALTYDDLSAGMRWTASATAWVGATFCLVAIALDPFPTSPDRSIWLYYRDRFLSSDLRSKTILAGWLILLALIWSLNRNSSVPELAAPEGTVG